MARDERTYVKVHDGIEDHPKVAPLSDRAFRLLVTTWGWCSRHLTDGRVPLAVWRQRGTPKARAELVNGGLVEVCGDHVVMHDYLDHQRSAAEVEERRQEKRTAGIRGAHKRWHSQSKPDKDCPHCIADGWHKPSQPPSQVPSHMDGKAMAETETETEVHVPKETWGGGVTEVNAHERPPDHCPKHPGGTERPCRACADARRSAEDWDAAELARAEAIARDIEQAKRDPRNRCEHGTDGGRFPHPRTGLSATCALCRVRTQEAS